MSILGVPVRPGQCQTVHEVIEMYVAEARRDLSARSYETISCILRRFDESAGQLTLAECRPFDLQCWLNEHPEYRSEWYRRCVISSIKRAFNWAYEMELIGRNPFARLRSRARPQCRRPMTDNEASQPARPALFLRRGDLQTWVLLCLMIAVLLLAARLSVCSSG
jgi:hypothetical protein